MSARVENVRIAFRRIFRGPCLANFLVAGGIAVSMMIVFHRPLLRLMATPLVAAGDGEVADYVLLIDGDREYETAAAMWHVGKAERIPIVEE